MILEQNSTDESVPLRREAKPSAQIPPEALAIVPLRNTVLYPYTVMPLTIGRPSSLLAVEDAVRKQLPIGVVTQQDPAKEAPQITDLYEIGTTADIIRISPARDGQRQVIVQGRQRFKIIEPLQSEPFLVVRVSLLEENVPRTKEFEARIMHLREQASKALSLLPQPSAELQVDHREHRRSGRAHRYHRPDARYSTRRKARYFGDHRCRGSLTESFRTPDSPNRATRTETKDQDRNQRIGRQSTA